MSQSRQNKRSRVNSVQLKSRAQKSNTQAMKLHQSTFLKRFEGKINVVTRQAGLRGVLMKTIKMPSNRRYKVQNLDTVCNSRVVTQLLQPNKDYITIPHSAQSEQIRNKQNVDNNVNFRVKKIESRTLAIQIKGVEEKAVSPFNLPRLQKKQVKMPRMRETIQNKQQGVGGKQNKVIRLR